MPFACYILFGAAFTVAVATAVGKLLLAGMHADLRTEEHWIFGFATGSACLSLLVFALAAAGLLYKGVLLACGLAILAVAAWKGSLSRPALRWPRLPSSRWGWLFGLAFAVFAVFYLLTAMLPEHSADGYTYHLGPVARYLRAHGFERIETDMRANLSQGLEMLFLFAFAFGRHSAAALVHFSFLAALPCALFAYGRRFGMAFAGAAGGLIVFVSPVVGMTGTCAYNDVALAFSLFALFYVLQVWDEHRDPSLSAVAGLLAGFCFAIKYTGFTGVVYALGFTAWRLLRTHKPLFKPLALVGGCSALIGLPWVVRNCIWFGNPLWPFLNGLFPNPFMHLSFEQEWGQAMRFYPGLRSYLDIPLEATVRGGVLAGMLGPLFLLTPVALIALRWQAGRRLLFAGTLFASTYFGNIGTRFLIPPLPFWSLALAMALAQYRAVAAVIVLLHAVSSWPNVLRRYAPHAWKLEGVPLKAAFRLEGEDRYLLRRLPSYAIVRLLETETPPNAKVFAFEQLPDAYTSRRIVVSFQGAFNEIIADLLRATWPSVRHSLRFPSRPLRAIRVVQSRSGAEIWSVSEMRVLANGSACPPRPEWRLRARPNPWDIGMAFDSNPVTRWRSWEPEHPGMFLEVNFNRSQTVDEVQVDMTSDGVTSVLKLEGRLPSGEWTELPAVLRQSLLVPPQGVRRTAMAEVKRRGIDYIVFNSDSGWTATFTQDPSSWGLRLAGRRWNYGLYRID